MTAIGHGGNARPRHEVITDSAQSDDPCNPRSGWWRVVGIRHSAIARASSAREAVEKALNARLAILEVTNDYRR